MSELELKCSLFADRTINPLRKLWERDSPKPNPDKSVIMLQPGDPTMFGNFPPFPGCLDAISDAVYKDKFSYEPSAGIEAARQAVAEYSKHMGDVTSHDVFLASGCSMAIEMCFMVLANPGENILVPRPAWNYSTWILGSGIEMRSYNLDPSKNWDIDLKHLESLIDEKTRAILVNSPGNPCGNVFSKDHILEILEVAERHKLPIISDEVYEFFVFPGVTHNSFAELSKNVPILTCSGLTKRFVIPAIRMGWIIVNDRGNRFTKIREGLANIAGRNFGPNSTIQLALPKILSCVPQSFFDSIRETVGHHGDVVYKLLKEVKGLKPVMPKGAMYVMVGIELDKFPKFPTSLAFMRGLASEQSVFVFPGEGFNFPGYLRLVISTPEDMLVDACKRMKEFCDKHYEA